MNQPAAAKKVSKPAGPPAKHYVCFRLVDLQNSPVGARRYTLEWTDVGATAPTRREGVTGADGRTLKITTLGQVAVSLAIAPPAGGQCRPVGQSVQSKPENKPFVVTVRLAFNATAITAPQSLEHCETLTLRQGKQRVKYVINNVTTVGPYKSNLRWLPYIVVDVDTLEVLHAGQSAGHPALFSGTNSQVSTAEINVDGVREVGVVLGAAANGDWDLWRKNSEDLVMYRVRPESDGLTTVVVTEKKELDEDRAVAVLTRVTASGKLRAATLNGRVWAACTRTYSLQEIGVWITGNLTLPDPNGDLTSWYEVARPSLLQIDWAEQHGKISNIRAAEYRRDLSISPSIAARSLPPLRMQLKWSELLGPLYSNEIVNVASPARSYCQGGEIIIAPLNLTLKLLNNFCDNAGRYAGTPQAEVVAKNHPYVYMMLLSACAEAGVNSVTVSGMWRPMLGSVMHKRGDALDIVKVDALGDRLPEFGFNGSNVAGNALAKRFNKFLHDHRYADPKQHIYISDEYSHPSDSSHDDHLHITCNSRLSLMGRDHAGYRAAGDPGSPFPPPFSPDIPGMDRPWLV